MSLHLGGSHPLAHAQIDGEVTGHSPGNYALGYLDGGTFVVFYVGRSDTDVNDTLHDWVGAESTFTRWAPSAQAGYGTRRTRLLPAGAPELRPVGVAVDGRYTHFEFSYAASAAAAFERECRSYHDFGGSRGLDNDRHPVAPEGTSWECPIEH